MVEEANEYYKSGLHRLYDIFQDAEVFSELRQKYSRPHQRPTAQEIVRVSGAPSADKPHEGGVDSIREHLAIEDRPMLVRQGEWDRVPSTEQPLSPTATVSSSAIDSAKTSPTMQSRALETDPSLTRKLSHDNSNHLSQQRDGSFTSQNFIHGSLPVPTTQSAKEQSVSHQDVHPIHLRRHPNTFPGAMLRRPHPSHVAGPSRGAARSQLTSHGNLRHTPYPSLAGLMPPSVHPRNFAPQSATVSTSQAEQPAFDIEFASSPPTICPADLELGTTQAPSQLLEADLVALEDLSTHGLVGMAPEHCSGEVVVGVDDFEVALAVAAAGDSPNPTMGLRWPGVGLHGLGLHLSPQPVMAPMQVPPQA